MAFQQTILRDGGGGGGGGGGGNRFVMEEPAGDENVELSLGLSLNGRFGVKHNYDDDNNNRLIRASSVADFSSFPSADDDPTPWTVYPPLTRTCSLPTETEEEWKNRKELQSLRRSEAKRKRVEKLKNVTVVHGPLTAEDCDAKRTRNELWGSAPPSLLPPMPRPPTFPSQVSVGSPGSVGSSGVSDLESQPFSGINKDTDLNNATFQPFVSRSYRPTSFDSYKSNKANLTSEHVLARVSTLSSQAVATNGSPDKTLKTMLADMPCVSIKGDDVNGKKTEGFLYRYKKGEEVRIVCVCHGSFLTPAEFVKHGGGGDVEHPLRHIVVSPYSL